MSEHFSYEGYTQTTQCAEGAPSTDFLDNGNGLWMELYDLDSFVLTDTPSGSAPLYEDTPLPEAAPQYLDTNGPTIHVSDTFHPHANLDATPPNIVLVSSDEIFFLVHYHKLMSASYNAFAGLFFPGSHITGEALTLILPDSSDTLNVVLHCIYNISCDNYHPTFECLSASLSAFEKYGLALPHYLACGTPLYSTILTFAPVRPIETYALAASHALEDLAVAASSYTLHIKVHNIPQNLADQMGPQYLQRLHHLHASRTSRLKALLDEMPYPHVEKPHCSVGQRQVLSRAYHLAGSQVLYDATPAISSSGIEMTMRGLIEAVSCPDCKNALTAHVAQTVKKWMLFKSTI